MLGFAQKQPLNKPAAVANVQVKPIVVSTWQHGLAANQEAWGILVKHGKAIDAVEAGVRIPEADPDSNIGATFWTRVRIAVLKILILSSFKMITAIYLPTPVFYTRA